MTVSMSMATCNSSFVFWSQINVNEVILKINLKLIGVKLSCLIKFSLVKEQIKINSFDFLDSENWNSSKWLVAACYGITSTLEDSECFLSNLNPSIKIAWVQSCFILNELSLKEDFVIRIVQID